MSLLRTHPLTSRADFNKSRPFTRQLPHQYDGDSPPEKTCADKTAQYNKWIRLSG